MYLSEIRLYQPIYLFVRPLKFIRMQRLNDCLPTSYLCLFTFLQTQIARKNPLLAFTFQPMFDKIRQHRLIFILNPMREFKARYRSKISDEISKEY